MVSGHIFAKLVSPKPENYNDDSRNFSSSFCLLVRQLKALRVLIVDVVVVAMLSSRVRSHRQQDALLQQGTLRQSSIGAHRVLGSARHDALLDRLPGR